MGDGDDSGSHVPRQAHERADNHQDGHPEEIQVIPCPFLRGDMRKESRRMSLSGIKLQEPKYTDEVCIKRISPDIKMILWCTQLYMNSKQGHSLHGGHVLGIVSGIQGVLMTSLRRRLHSTIAFKYNTS